MFCAVTVCRPHRRAKQTTTWAAFIRAHLAVLAGTDFLVLRLRQGHCGWDRLKELVEAHEDADARHQALVDLIAPAARNIHAYWLARPCTCERHHRRYATTDSQGARSRPQRPMPLWLWQEVQILPWSTEIVALTCGTRNSCDLLTQVSTARLLRNTVRNQKIGKLSP